MDDEQLITELLAPKTAKEAKRRRLAFVQEAIDHAVDSTASGSEARRVLILALHRLRRFYEEQP